MGNPKLKWTSEEEEALRAGVAKHGAGKWKNIQRDPEFNHLLFARSNIDLKDKWRNLGVASGSCPREKSKTPKAKADPVETPDTSLLSAQNASIAPSPHDPSTDAVIVDSPKPLPEANSAAKLNVMIYEALSTLKQPNGSDSGAIANFIEQNHEPPLNFKRALSSRLRRLVQQDKLEKVQNCYRIKKDGVPDTRTPAMNQRDPQPRPFQGFGHVADDTVEEATVSAAYRIAEAENKAFVAAEAVQNCYRIKKDGVPDTRTPAMNQRDPQPRPLQGFGHVADDTVEEATVSAAYRIAEAENKAFVAAEAVKEAERATNMAEEMESLLQFATYCFEQSAQGEILLMV